MKALFEIEYALNLNLNFKLKTLHLLEKPEALKHPLLKLNCERLRISIEDINLLEVSSKFALCTFRVFFNLLNQLLLVLFL